MVSSLGNIQYWNLVVSADCLFIHYVVGWSFRQSADCFLPLLVDSQLVCVFQCVGCSYIQPFYCTTVTLSMKVRRLVLLLGSMASQCGQWHKDWTTSGRTNVTDLLSEQETWSTVWRSQPHPNKQKKQTSKQTNKQTTKQTSKQANWLTDWLTHQPINQPANQLINQLANSPTN